MPSTILVIFGITGDLSRRYLLPALAEICANTEIGKDFRVLGVSRRQVDLNNVLGAKEKNLKAYSQMLTMDLANRSDYQKLKDEIGALSQKFTQGPQVIFYLSVPPAAADGIVGLLGESGLSQPPAKLLLEKPFGYDLSSAQEMIGRIAKYFSQEQVYRIDHYLAKESAQNIAVFLGSNALFRNIWSNQFIDHIDIVAAEDIGIGGRKEFWEATGMLRDFVQSHLLQLAALTLMEPCSHMFDFAQLPERRLAALQKMKIAELKSAVRGQYRGYRQEVGNPNSAVDTFVSLTLDSSDSRWRGVPIRLTTGKKLDQKLTKIDIHFKKSQEAEANLLTLRLHPREGIELDLWVKEPGYRHNLQKQPLRFIYEQRFGRVPEAYEQVLIDAMRAKKSLFASSEEVLTSWKILQPVLDYWSMSDSDLKIYQPGSTIEEVLQQRAETKEPKTDN